MRKWIAAALVAGCLAAPGGGVALADQGQALRVVEVPKEQALAIGAGVIAGALVVHFVVPGDFAYFAGGVAGGLVAWWWYEHHDGGPPPLRPNRAAAVTEQRVPFADGAAPPGR